MLWHIQTLFHALVVFGAVLLYALRVPVVMGLGTWLFFAVQKIGA